MNNRRKLLIALGAGALGVSPALFAQTQRIHRVGMISAGSALSDVFLEFQQELKRLGYVDGQSISYVVRFSQGHLERLPALISELVAEKVDVIFAPSGASAKAARQAVASIPVVFAVVYDPVALGLVASLARPGSNMTGTASLNNELAGKRLEILKELSPTASRIAVLVSDEPQAAPVLEQVQAGAKILGMSVLTAQLVRREDLESVSKQLRAWRANAIFVADTSTNSGNAKLLAELAARLRLPAMYGWDRYTDAGGLMCYGPNYKALYRRSAHYVDKILKGAKPADLPIEQPTHYELIINMKTAKALGIKVPQSLLARADRVIE